MTHPSITVGELKNASPQGALVDVRTPAEFAEVHAQGAQLFPLDKLDIESLRTLAQKQTLYLLCRSGTRARTAADKLLAAGVSNLLVVEGGTNAWVDASLPVKRGKKTISLERQVRIAAGVFVLVGVLLGWFVHRGFFGISAFVGAGLVFAGITDTCGMGILLARAPWNQRK